MKLIILVLASVIACSSAAAIFDATLDSAWTDFKKVFNKEYRTIEEATERRLTWESNHKYISRHNLEHALGRHTFTVKMNKYGDMTNKEFGRLMNGYKSGVAKSENKFVMPSNVQIPDSVDWRTQGYVTPIKDQGQCGSCWAFSAVASLEGQHFKKSGTLVSLSEQNLVDCSSKFGNQGCNGGLMDQAFSYIVANKGIDTEDSYPYRAVDQKCQFKAANIGATETGFVDVKSGDEAALTAAIATIGPIATAMDASQSTFQFYSSGIYSDSGCSSTNLDHGVTLVGYGSLEGQDYYILKNMWGLSWGDKGYVLIARNANNMCGVATTASYPLV
jgi:cathepsin L